MKKQRNYQETHLGSCNRVSVGKEFKGSCSIERCKCRIVVHVFIDDGQPKSSRYWGSYCRKHLSIGIKSGWIKNDVVYKKLRRQDYSRDY